MVNGLKLYDELFDDSGVRKMVNLVNDLRAAGRRGLFQGKFIHFLMFNFYIYIF